jgi:glycerol-3-phosphate dehydrogenase (NAD(P)+)
MRICVLGGGSWGTALGLHSARLGHSVCIWEFDPALAQVHQAARENIRYLPGIPFPDNLKMCGDLQEALSEAEMVLLVVPSQTMRATLHAATDWIPKDAILCVASKGVEQNSLMTMDEVICDVLGDGLKDRIAVLSGPSFALELAQGKTTAVVVASKNPQLAEITAGVFHGGNFRVYHSDDVVGVEMGGALKNVMAIACGICDGAGLGTNCRAALITRGLAEITRLAVARGANPLTLAGLAGMGDLVLTCTGDLSRNRRVGLALGKGQSLDSILAELGQVAEGVMTARSAYNLGKKAQVDMPITREVYAMLYEGKPVPQALGDLLGRDRKAERD